MLYKVNKNVSSFFFNDYLFNVLLVSMKKLIIQNHSICIMVFHSIEKQITN